MITPAQRKYDQDLADNLRAMSHMIAPRSRKLQLILARAAERIDDLVMRVPLDPTPTLDPHGNIQPASTPVQAQTP